MLNIVRAATSGPWRSVDLLDGMGNKIGEKVLVVAHENGRWCVDNNSVDVWPGLCVSFRDPSDAMWFVDQNRAGFLAVEPEFHVAFADTSDAQFFVSKGLGDMLSQREAEDLMARMEEANAAAQDVETNDNEGGSDMSDGKGTGVENKMQKAPEPKKAPKPARASGGKK